MTLKPGHLNRAAPLLWVTAGGLFCLAAWLGQEIAFAGIGVMFMTLGLAAWLKTRKAGGE